MDPFDLLDPDAAAAMRQAVYSTFTGDVAAYLAEVRGRLDEAPYPDDLPELASVTDEVADGPAGPIPVRLHRPTTETGGPVIVYFHGGGMVMGSVRAYHPVATQLAAASGATVVNVDYRLAPEHPVPAQADDAYAAMCWVAENAERLGVDPDRLAVCGDSAGGTLAASVALRARDLGGPPILCQVMLYAGVDYDLAAASMREFAEGPGLTRASVKFLKRLAGTVEAHDSPYAVPAMADDLTGLPQAIVATAEVDPIRDWSERYAERLRDARVQVTTVRYPGLQHGFISRAAELQRARLAMAELGGLLQAKFAHPLPRG